MIGKGGSLDQVKIPEGLARPSYPVPDDDPLGTSVIKDESQRMSYRVDSFNAGDLHRDSNMGPSLKKPVIFFALK